jgi:hypothetical protein
VLLVRRAPAVLAVGHAAGLRREDAVFTAWFGTMGVSALFYLAHSMDEGVSDPRLLAFGTLAVTASVIAFGVTAAPFRRLYAKLART